MDVAVVGASRGSGLAVVRRLAADGHRVAAVARSVGRVALPDGVVAVAGDVADPMVLDRAVRGRDAVVVTLGISDDPIAVRLRRRASSALDVRSAGTAAVVAAMRRHGVRRLVVQTTYGAGESWAGLSLRWRATFRLVLGPQLADSNRQEDVVRTSGLDWTLVRPVALHDEPAGGPVEVSDVGRTVSMRVARAQVADVVVRTLLDPGRVGSTLAVSS